MFRQMMFRQILLTLSLSSTSQDSANFFYCFNISEAFHQTCIFQNDGIIFIRALLFLIGEFVGVFNLLLTIIFSERDYVTFANCRRNSVCRLSVVCDVGAPYSGG